MDQILKFPDPLQQARLRAEEFQRLSPDESWRTMASMMAVGWQMVRSSPNREIAEQRMAEQELPSQRFQSMLRGILLKMLAYWLQDQVDTENLVAATRGKLNMDWIRSEW